MMLLLELFWSFFKVGIFSFGGGYAALPLIQAQVVTEQAWLSMQEFTDLITISQMTPGPIAINSATFVGTKLAGFAGALVATLGVISPSLIIVGIAAYVYFKFNNASFLQAILGGLRPVVVALIASSGVTILIAAFWGSPHISALKNIELLQVVFFCLSIFAMRKYKISPILVMFATGLLGGIIYTLMA